MQGMNLSSSLSTDKFPTPDNGTNLRSKIYVFTPAGSSTKLTLVTLMVTIGIIGFVGNVLILCFLKAKQMTTSILNALSFQKNFNFYIKSLAISNILSDIIPLPCRCLQHYFEIFQDGWGCRIMRYLQIAFPCVTLNNLLVISIEKYFATRNVPRPFRHSTVKKWVLLAWFAGLIFALFPAATYKGIRYDLNETHYTVVCKYDNNYLPFKVIFLNFLFLQYILPSFLIIAISICLIITVRTTTKRITDIQQDNAIKAMARAANRRAIIIIVALMFAFIIPYSLYFSHGFYNFVFKKYIDFQTDYRIRHASGVMAYSNSLINVIIYLVQMKDFRAFLKKHFIKKVTPENPNSREVTNAEIEMQ